MRSEMSRLSKVAPEHLERSAYVYVRQSSPRQVHQHRESTRRQYNLVRFAERLGWSPKCVVTVDEDQGKSGALARARSGFGRLVKAVGSGQVGIVISLEVSRLARNSPDWHNLIYLSRYTQTLIADGETIYDPADSSDRMVLGMRGQVSELELDTLIQRMVAARWSQAERGEARWRLPAGYDRDADGEVDKTSDEAVREALETVFAKFSELGCVSHVYEYFRDSGRQFPVRRPHLPADAVAWVEPGYAMISRVLHNPIYAGAYVYGRTQTVREVDAKAAQSVRVRRVKRDEWPVLLQEHHPAYISYEEYLHTQQRIRANARMGPREQDSEQGAAREGPSLLQGLVVCGACGRKMQVSYGGPSSGVRPYHYYRCAGGHGRTGRSCQVVNGRRLDAAVVALFLDVLSQAGDEAALLAAATLDDEQRRVEQHWALQVEQAAYRAERAARQYDAVEPENRIVARELERRWNQRLEELEQQRALARAARREQRPVTEQEVKRAHRLGRDIAGVWEADTTTNRDRKRLLRCLIEEVQTWTDPEQHRGLVLWHGGASSEVEIERVRRGQAYVADEEKVNLVRQLATEFNDAQIARVLARRGIYNLYGRAYTRSGIVSLRKRHSIPACPQQRPKDPQHGPFTAQEAARELDVSVSTIHRWLREGILRGGQVAEGAPWRIQLDEAVRRRLTAGDAPDGWVGLSDAARRLGMPKSTVAHWVNTGKLESVRTMKGNRSCWKINISSAPTGRQAELLDQMNSGCFTNE